MIAGGWDTAGSRWFLGDAAFLEGSWKNGVVGKTDDRFA